MAIFLTDSSGGEEVAEDREEYARRRRGEARAALEVLGRGRSNDRDSEGDHHQ